MHMIKILEDMQENLLDEIDCANEAHAKSDKPATAEDAARISHLMKALYHTTVVLAMEEAAEGEPYGDDMMRAYRDVESMRSRRFGARGRSRDSMGRFADGDPAMESRIKEIMRNTTDERTKEELRRMLDR